MMTPILTDGEFWHQTGRWDNYGPELMRIKDRHDREFVLGPTHEETYTALVRDELRSYKQLPVTLYHIQDKFRDELRPRFGLMRGREFIMKDAYSFSADQESLQQCYDDQKGAYARFCARCGLKALPVAADTGQIGGDTSVEYMALAEAGEAELVYCEDCGFAADTEAATAACEVTEGVAGEMRKVETPGIGTIADLAALMKVPESATRKAIALVDGDGKPWVVIVPGDHEVNDVKAEHAFGSFHMMSDEELEEYGLHKGFMGPVNLPAGVSCAADIALKGSEWWLVGANEDGYHLQSAKPGRDFEVGRWVDIITARPGDTCPHCGKPLSGARGPWARPSWMSTARRSPFRWAATASVSPVPLPPSWSSTTTRRASSSRCPWPPTRLRSWRLMPRAKFSRRRPISPAGSPDVILDDRKERPGVKFAEADLMGFPYQVVIGKRGIKAGVVEVKCRETGEREDVALDGLASYLTARIVPARQGLLTE